MTLRRIVQSLLFVLFLFLIFFTVFRERWDGLMPYLPVDLFLRLDPIALLGPAIAERHWVKGIALLIPIVVTTVVLGRVFCGWMCPLGTTLDLFEKVARSSYPVLRQRIQQSLTYAARENRFLSFFTLRSKYYLLFALVVAALLGVQATWTLDPIPIVTRSYATALLPLAEWTMRLGSGPAQRSQWSSSAYAWAEDHLFSFQQPWYLHSMVVLGVFGVILLLSLQGRRWWCRNLCPLGALLGLLSWWKPVRIRTVPSCSGCGECATHCKMQAITLRPGEQQFTIAVDNRECIMCSTCIDECPKGSMAYALRVPQEQVQPVVDLPRRRTVAALASGLVLGPTLQLDFARVHRDRWVLRPPCIGTEAEFLSRCIRCGECMKVCLTNVLHPTFLETGLSGMFSPMMLTRYSYCAYDCTLCGQVCPTGAIPYFTPEHKHARSQGLAVFDKNRCIPYVENRDCLVCEEHCPTPSKAIVFQEEEVELEDGSRRRVKRPVVRPELCVGCGICETKCPVEGRSAIIVYPYSPQKSLLEIKRSRQSAVSSQPSAYGWLPTAESR